MPEYSAMAVVTRMHGCGHILAADAEQAQERVREMIRQGELDIDVDDAYVDVLVVELEE